MLERKNEKDMVLTMNRKMMKNMIEQYYQRFYNMEITADIRASKERIGYYEEEGCMVTIVVRGVKKLMGESIPYEERITEEKLEEICKEMFALEEMEVLRISFNSGLSTSVEGYGCCEHTVKSAYFHGIDVTVNPIQQMNLVRK